jgi:hypothetical protein
MKNNNDLFSEKMPSDLKNKILASSKELLKKNQQKQRRSFFMWMAGSALAALSASYVYFKLPLNKDSESFSEDIAQNFDIYNNIESEEDIDLLADLEFLEDFDVLEQLDEEA